MVAKSRMGRAPKIPQGSLPFAAFAAFLLPFLDGLPADTYTRD